MLALDIPFPESEFLVVDSKKHFNLIYPLEHPLAQAIKVDMVIRAICFADEEFNEFMKKSMIPADMNPLDGKMFEIGYIRDTTLSGIAKFEWARNYGPNNAKNYMKYVDNVQLDSYVRLVFLKPIQYNLKSLNNIYGH